MAKNQKEKQTKTKIKKSGSARKPKADVSERTKPSAPSQSLPSALSAPETDEPTPRLIVRGIVSNSDLSPAAGLTVIAYDKDVVGEDRLGEATTGDKGNYQIIYDDAQFRRSKNESRGADVFVRVYSARRELLFQSRLVRNAPALLQMDVRLPGSQILVRGTVVDADGAPLDDVIVRAFDCSLRSEQMLGEDLTGADGQYEISGKSNRSAQVEKDSVNLVVRAFIKEAGSAAEPAVQSTVLFNAPPVSELDLTVPAEILKPPTLFEKIGRALAPRLDGIPVRELEEEKERRDLSLLSGETGFEKNLLARFVLAHKLDAQVIPTEIWFAFLGGSFYEYTDEKSLVEQLTAIQKHFPALDAAAARKSLIRSFNEKEIPEKFGKDADRWVKAFLKFAAAQIVGESAGSNFVKAALADAGIDDEKKREKFALLFNEHRSLTPELLRSLGKDRSFKEPEIADLRASFELSNLTRGDFGVVRAIKQAFDVRKPEQIRALAKKSEGEWVNFVKERHEAGDFKLPIEVDADGDFVKFPSAELYGRMLERRFCEAFPTAAFNGGLSRALQNGGAQGLRRAEAMNRFLIAHESFELLSTPVDDFFKNDVQPEFKKLVEEEDFRLEIKAVQRVFKLAPNFEAVDALLTDNQHSAQKIYRIGEAQFVQRYADRAGFTAETARLAWNRAADTYAAVLTIFGDLSALAPEAVPAAMKNGNAALEKFPNWNNLFKTGDLCECEHCRSALGPAAYFADLLMFLRDRYAVNGSVKDVLFRRRGDLGYLELSCDNALTPLPYIDVVCEVLEKAIASGSDDIELTGFTAMPADPALIKRVVLRAFLRQGISIGDDFSISQVSLGDPDRWVAHGDDATYLLKKKANSNFFFAEILPNTKASAAELRAYPQYVNQEAYKKLRAAKYPLTLPFDLYAEEVRAAFQKTNLQRWELMRALRGDAPPNNPTDDEIAAEYFGISVDPSNAFDEKRLIFEADETNAGQQELWGATGANWLDIIGNVKNFLRKTGLEYNEMLALLDLKFINPDGSIVIEYTAGPSCDTDKQAIKKLDAAKLDRIHRFLRLWRKLKGWKMWELDLVIRQPALGKGSIDVPFLLNLFYFSRLKNKLGSRTTVEQVIALFGDLNTETRFTKLHEKRDAGHYQNLFLNKLLIQPLDLAFDVAEVTRPAPTGEKISHHQSVVLAALGIREADLALFKGMTKASGRPYIEDDLTLTNLSFIWRHAWLSKLLNFKAEDWKILLKIFQQDVMQFDSPQAAWEFVKNVEDLQAAGLTPDELNGLLAADRTAKSAPKETEAARFLAALRRQLQDIRAEYDPAQYDFLTAAPPSDTAGLTGLLTSLLQKLNRDEAAVNTFLKALRGNVLLEAAAAGLPPGFAFPAAITGSPNNIPVRFDAPAKTMRFNGLMTDAQREILLDENAPALATLRAAGEIEAAAPELPTGFAFPAVITGAPNNIPIRHDETDEMLRFSGLMTEAQRETLLDENAPALATLRAAGEITADVRGLPTGFTFPPAITGAPNAIPVRFDEQNNLLRFNGLVTGIQRATLLDDDSLVDVSGNQDYRAAIEELYRQSFEAINKFRNAIEELYQQSLKTVAGYRDTIEELYQQSLDALTDYLSLEKDVALPGNFVFPQIITGAPHAIPIRYEQALRFSGVMTAAQRAALLNDPSLAAVTGIAAYREAIEELYNAPRLALKFFEPIFFAPLSKLPPAVDFKAQLPDEPAAKISYDAERRLLRFDGLMSDSEKSAILALSVDADYAAAVNSLAAQPQDITFPDKRIWLTDDDLDLTQPSNDTFAKRLANACMKALAYLSKTSAENAVVQHGSSQLGLTEALTRRLLTHYSVVPTSPAPPPPAAVVKKTLMEHLTGNFTIDPTTCNGWFWAIRVATIWRRWKITLAELESITALTRIGKLFDFLTLPLDNTGVIPPNIPSLERFLRTGRLLRLRETLPETGIRLLEVMEKLAAGTYATPADFAVDVQRLNEEWGAADAEQLVAALDLTYPDAYLLSENWERLREAFYFLDNLNGGADTVKEFAAATMSDQQGGTIKDLLRSKFGTETWLPLSAEIQDVLRERKRDALAAYLLTRSKPVNAPSGKWENINDLYAYYLLNVEMSSCQLTSRLVQASGSVQLFVQRCFMGLEPEVRVQADGVNGDTAWNWWKWMRKYRVWEANRKVFLYPENWIEPELKKDRSQFFKDLENELLQKETNQSTAETAVLNYLEKLDGVAQLEIAGFYQEDDRYNTVVHVFGRTVGTEPHIYYYRRYDYLEWTPWEKVELDIQGDYLIPAVINRRLLLFWPIFTEVPDEAGNSTTTVIPTPGQTNFTPDKTKKRLRLQMAVSQYRQGQWTPKKVSKTYDESAPYSGEIVSKYYRFFPIDRSDLDGRFFIMYEGNSYDRTGFQRPARLKGEMEISGCGGVGELTFLPGNAYTSSAYHTTRPESVSTGEDAVLLKWVELKNRLDNPENDLTLKTNTYISIDSSREAKLLAQTPEIFKVSPAWHYSYMDKLGERIGIRYYYSPVFAGTWLPFFYHDKERTFFVQPSSDSPTVSPARGYYAEIKSLIRSYESFFGGQAELWADSFVATLALDPVRRTAVTDSLVSTGRLSWQPSYTDLELKNAVMSFPVPAVYAFLVTLSDDLLQQQQFRFRNFYHPFVCDFAKLVNNPLEGITGLMNRETQFKDTGFRFFNSYQPTASVVEPTGNPQMPDSEFYPREEVDFTIDGAYSSYNWELFFHAPLLIAGSLSKNQRFEEARDWYHFIFNPLGVGSAAAGGSPMSKYWITKPFFETTDPQYVQQRIDNILSILAGDASVPGFSYAAQEAIRQSVFDWRANPFEPHRIAKYRTVAYQKTVVMKYLDNLIAWGDSLFRQDTMESINEATQLYVLAAEILGPRPKSVPPRVKPPLESYNELEEEFDAFSNALVQVENLVPLLPGSGSSGANLPPLPMLYFCIPQNDKMLGYWDVIADRLYKISRCMNIEGVERGLALFEPPIDPGALVKAVAGGADINAALADLNAPLPLYRFNVLLQKANEVCNDVRALGAALLAALEKKDAEALGQLRQSQEIRLLEAVKAVREKQIEEAKQNVEGLKKSKAEIQTRKDYYQNIEKIISGEMLSLTKQEIAFKHQMKAQDYNVIASVLGFIPNVTIGVSGFGGSPQINAQWGTGNIISALQAAAGSQTQLSNAAGYEAGRASTLAGYDRRYDDWKLQERLADKQLEQIDEQIATAELRVAIAEKELDDHVLQIENARETDAFMRSKYTNEELYQWQLGQVSGVYFQNYRLAYDLAKRAERCFRFELGLSDSSFINFGYWDSLKKGLHSGERLQYDLRRLETAYLEQNRREFELTKHISLALLDPLALVKLRETGRCFLSLPEEIFDLDYPGHYFRRIKSVSLTLPCVVGPYTTISCTLRLLKNTVRVKTANGANGYARNTDDRGLPADDERFVENNIPVRAIAASSGQNDSGVFELGFRDERYLPFEGAGAVSEWSLELVSDLPANNPDPANPDFGRALRQFDYNSISDVILHLKYTAREDAGAFKNGAVKHLRNYFQRDGATTSLRMFNMRQEFPTAWHRFLNPRNPINGNVLELAMNHDLFPFRDKGKTLKINSLWLFGRCRERVDYKVVMTPPLPEPPPSGANVLSLAPSNQYGGLHFAQKDVAALEIEVEPSDPPIIWQLKMSRSDGGNLQIEDLFLVLGYEWKNS